MTQTHFPKSCYYLFNQIPLFAAPTTVHSSGKSVINGEYRMFWGVFPTTIHTSVTEKLTEHTSKHNVNSAYRTHTQKSLGEQQAFYFFKP